MLRLLPVLVLAAAVFAEDRFPAILKAFNKAREKPLAPGSRARVNPAVEEIVGLKDPRAVQPLSVFIVEMVHAEERIFEDMRVMQVRGAEARKRTTEIETQLRHLDVRLRAGATDVAPQIDALKRESEAMERLFKTVRDEVQRQDRSIEYARELRDMLADGCVDVLRTIKDEYVPASLKLLRRGFDIAKDREALMLVRVLRGCARGTAKHLIDIVTHPKVGDGPRRQAVSALALSRDREGIDELIKLWERDPDAAGPYVRHALSVAAGRPLDGITAARTWAKTLK